jgi:acetyl esterase/lipase
MSHTLVLTLCLAAAGAALAAPAPQQAAAPSAEQLQALLKQFPAADANRDGILSLEEAQDGLSKLTAARRPAAARKGLPPTLANLKYGPHERNVLDLWTAPSNRPAPLVVYIHGGGFIGGDKSRVSQQSVAACRGANVAFASINYRFRKDAPIQDILHDAARAVQFLRLHAGEYGIDPARIACYGGSAGAGTSLWLATHDDLAAPASADPVLRQSSRLSAAACLNGQASYDLTTWDSLVGPFRTEWRSEPDEDVTFYHFGSRNDLTSEAGKRVLTECDMLHWISKDDPPLYLSSTIADVEPTERNQYVHHPRHAKAVKARCDAVGEPCELALAPAGGEGAALRFLLSRLLEKNKLSATSAPTRR